MAIDNILVEVMLEEDSIRHILDGNADPGGFREKAAEVEILEVERGVASICAEIATIGDDGLPVELDEGDVSDWGGGGTVVLSFVAAVSASNSPSLLAGVVHLFLDLWIVIACVTPLVERLVSLVNRRDSFGID
jgi:hypothetical protein